jgi:hypothetical protein
MADLRNVARFTTSGNADLRLPLTTDEEARGTQLFHQNESNVRV